MTRWPAPRRPEPAPMPAELRHFDPREWAAPGEQPGDGSHPGYPVPDTAAAAAQVAAFEDYRRAYERYAAAAWAWIDTHPGFDWLEWLRTRRAGRRPPRRPRAETPS